MCVYVHNNTTKRICYYNIINKLSETTTIARRAKQKTQSDEPIEFMIVMRGVNFIPQAFSHRTCTAQVNFIDYF